ncbi:MAG: transporter substrate-binding domain-containing protein, partial [Silvanigrellaceae bacterium]|nr:transporter substrate-binding domain-containing protein [Silvanigrellaceae bacterium]
MFIRECFFKFIKLFILFGLLNNFESYCKDLVFCHDEIESFPWFEHEGNGLNTVEMNLVDEKLEDVDIKQQSLPWQSCLKELKENKIDGVFAASYLPERLEIGAYPGIPLGAKKGIPDESKRTHISEYALYIKKGSQVKWDGNKITGAKKVGAQSGFSILTLLKKQKEQKNIEFI